MTDVRLSQLSLYFLRLGATGFGGPIALVGYMQRDLTERREWYTPDEFRKSVVFAQLAPGPLAAQVAIYLGWLRFRVLGATIVGLTFVLPSFLMVLALAVAYQRFQGLPGLRAAFFGISAAVIALIARGALKLARLTVSRDRLLIAVFVLNAIATLLARAELVSLLVASGLAVALARRATAFPTAKVSLLAVLPAGIASSASATNAGLFLFFAKAGAVVFGSGLAIVPFLYATVQPLGWLTEQQFLDAVAVSLITPGPVVITVAFMGYLLAGPVGALLAAAGVFLPVYLAVILGAPLFDRWSNAPLMRDAVAGLASAAAGALAGAALLLAQRALTDWLAFIIAGVTLLLTQRFPRLPEPAFIFLGGVVGLWLR